jgi:hypothetical protein
MKTLPDGRISWTALVSGKKPGDIIEVPARIRSQAHTQLRRLGFQITSHIADGTATCTILSYGQKRTDLKHSDTPLPISAQIGQLLHAIREASDNHIYWQRQTTLRELGPSRTEAAARAIAWKQTLTRHRAKLAELETLTA